MFRRGSRKTGESERAYALLDAKDRASVDDWWRLAEQRLETGHGDTSWLTGNIMLTMALGFAANSNKSLPPIVYSTVIRGGYALRLLVDRYAVRAPLDASQIDGPAIDRLASLPRVPDVGTLTTDLSDNDEAMLEPIVRLVSDTAEASEHFSKIVSVEPAFWNACVSVATDRFQERLRQQGAPRRGRDLDVETVESFLRYGFVLRSLDEALGIASPADTSD